MKIVESASDSLDVPVQDLPPVSDVIDIEAVDRIVPDQEGESGATVTFHYAGLRFVVYPGKSVHVRPVATPGADPVDRV